MEGMYNMTPAIIQSIQKAFEMVNVSGNGALDINDFRELLNTMDVPLETEKQLAQLFNQVDSNHDGLISIENVKEMMMFETYNQMHSNRYFVAVSLDEAETIRGILHSKKLNNEPCVQGGTLEIGLHMLSYATLDASTGLTTAPALQRATAEQAFRFINSDLYYAKKDVSTLLRCLHFNSVEQRQTFFNEVRSCRRRVQKDWRETLVEPVLTTTDEYQWLEFHSMITAIRTRIAKKGMKLLDAFRAFDYNRDGLLSCSEFYGGLTWLGIEMERDDIYRLVKYIDKQHDGRIRFSDFEAVLSMNDNYGDDFKVDSVGSTSNIGAYTTLEKENDFKSVIVQPRQIPEIYVNKEQERLERKEEISEESLKEIQIKVKPVSNYKMIWCSDGTGSRQEVSIWTTIGTQNTLIKRNKYRVCLGHYAAVGFGNKSTKPPSSLKACTLELTDLHVGLLSRSSNLDEAHVNYLMPYPVAFKLQVRLIRHFQQLNNIVYVCMMNRNDN